MQLNTNGKWIWRENSIGLCPEQVLFLRDFQVETVPEHCTVCVCADSRYILYVNNRIVLRGPCRGQARFRYYEELDISPYLSCGENRLIAQVIHYSGDNKDSNQFVAGPASVTSTMRGGFFLREKQTSLGISTDEKWLCARNEGYGFIPWAGYLPYMEKRDFTSEPQYPAFGCANGQWDPACEVYDGDSFIDGGLASIWNIKPRTIPLMPETHCDYTEIESNGASLLREDKKETVIEPNRNVLLELDPGEYVTAFPIIELSGGKGATIRLYYTELDDLNASDYEESIFDEYVVSDYPVTVMPFYYRAFRKIGLSIRNQNEKLVIHKLAYNKTGYPLSRDTEFASSVDCWNKLWEISVRTLNCCMYETYMDCPFYEQMQYIMDTMLQMTYSYHVTGDDRLARKAIDDFASAQLENGMIPCHSPSRIIQLIPGFNVYFFLMLTEHYKYFGDRPFIKRYLPVAKRAFYLFTDHISDEGLIERTGYWQFVDWVKGWDNGCPTTDERNYIISMMFSYAFRMMAEMLKEWDPAESAEYREASDSLNNAINRKAFDRDVGLYKDGPEATVFSQHAQLFAVLCEAITGEEARSLMTLAMCDPRVVSKCSFCMDYFLFRALEKSDCYSLSKPLWSHWTTAAEKGLTTWAEDPINGRSMCHAWSALPLSEFIICGLGLQPLEAGYRKVLIAPRMDWLGDCKGTVATPMGNISVSVRRSGQGIRLKAELPEARFVKIIRPDNSVVELPDAKSIDLVF